MFSLYVHIPFCEVKCGYCDFFSVAKGWGDADLQSRYVDALIREIEARAIEGPVWSGQVRSGRVRSVFFGGGTPSLLEPALMERVLETLRRAFPWSDDTEVTFEANPKTVTLDRLKTFRELGFNRLSIGIQSFQDRFLTALGRIHSGDEARQTLEDARHAGFDNFSLDLIFALPGQTVADWKRDLEEAIRFETPHLSAYHLIIEPGTPFESLHRSGRLHLPEEEAGVEMFQWTRSRLTEAGLPPYETSNFGRPGFESVHNRHYWQYGEYLGFGVSAASFVKAKEGGAVFGTRESNTRHLSLYMEGQRSPLADVLDVKTARGEFCMLGVRTREGISSANFQNLFGESLETVFGKVLKRCQDRGWLTRSGSDWQLTPEGVLFTDEVAGLFLG